MRRREFIVLVSGEAAWPVAAPAQQPAKLPIIGFLGSATLSAWKDWVAAFVQELRGLGWIEGRTVVIEYRWAEGRDERFAEIAAEYVQLKANVIVTSGSAVPALERETSTIPIVFAISSDPVGSGLVASLARPGGNVTGFPGKRIEVLREMVPGVRRLAILANPGTRFAVIEMSEAQVAARTLGVEVVSLEVRQTEDIAPAIESLGDRADALYVVTDPLANASRIRINALATAARLPTVHGENAYVEAGGLMSYGASYPDQFRRAAGYVDKILRVARPADLPIQQPTKFELALNLNTAKVLGLTIPPTLLSRADKVFE